MGKRGPQPKDQRLKDLEGNPGKRPRSPDPVKAKGAAKAPDWLHGYAAEIWKSIITSMPPGFYASVDTMNLASYCQAADMIKSASAEIKEHGITLLNANGNRVRNPACQVLSDGMAKVASIGARLGLDPSARQAMGVYAGGFNEEPEENEFGDLIAIKGGKA